MRYWHPMTARLTVEAVKDFERRTTIVLLPLYPQFSKTTSVARRWRYCGTRRARRHGLTGADDGRSAAIRRSQALFAAAAEFDPFERPWRRSGTQTAAHGCCSPPMVCRRKVVAAGDPYQWQVEQSVAMPSIESLGD